MLAVLSIAISFIAAGGTKNQASSVLLLRGAAGGDASEAALPQRSRAGILDNLNPGFCHLRERHTHEGAALCDHFRTLGSSVVSCQLSVRTDRKTGLTEN